MLDHPGAAHEFVVPSAQQRCGGRAATHKSASVGFCQCEVSHFVVRGLVQRWITLFISV